MNLYTCKENFINANCVNFRMSFTVSTSVIVLYVCSSLIALHRIEREINVKAYIKNLVPPGQE